MTPISEHHREGDAGPRKTLQVVSALAGAMRSAWDFEWLQGIIARIQNQNFVQPAHLWLTDGSSFSSAAVLLEC